MPSFQKRLSGGATALPWHTPFFLLALMSVALSLSFASWWALVKNFAVDGIGLTGREVGFQESIREIPGFLAFLTIYIVLFLREQTFAFISLLLLGFGVMITGYYPSALGLYITTFIMSLGFHYFETMNQSLSLQWLPKAQAPHLLGRLLAIGATAQLAAYGLVFLSWKTLELSFKTAFLIPGVITMLLAGLAWALFPRIPAGIQQQKKLILRKRYWLYYALTFMSGARRQIFTVFASLMMVEKFGYEVHHVAALFLVNCIFNMLFAGRVGKIIGAIGERRALMIEYMGLIGVFTAYAFVSQAGLAAALYIIDHAFFALAIAIKTYFQKIADPSEISPTAGISFTINHIAAVCIPAAFGLIWLFSPTAVFLAGAGMAAVSLLLSRLIPHTPEKGRETIFSDGALAGRI